MKSTPPAHENIVHLLPHRFVPLHSSHFVVLHLNFFFASTYVVYVPIKSMCGTRETLHMGILDSDQGESPFARPVHHHRGNAQGDHFVYTKNHIDDGLIVCRLLVLPSTFFFRGFSLDMPSSSSLLSVPGIIFLENVSRCGNVVSLFPSDFLSHGILARIAACTAKKRVLFGTCDVDCDSAHTETTLSLPVVAFELLGST
jgi:hypothetical protein